MRPQLSLKICYIKLSILIKNQVSNLFPFSINMLFSFSIFFFKIFPPPIYIYLLILTFSWNLISQIFWNVNLRKYLCRISNSQGYTWSHINVCHITFSWNLISQIIWNVNLRKYLCRISNSQGYTWSHIFVCHIIRISPLANQYCHPLWRWKAIIISYKTITRAMRGFFSLFF